MVIKSRSALSEHLTQEEIDHEFDVRQHLKHFDETFRRPGLEHLEHKIEKSSALFNTARGLMEQGRFEEAAETFKQSIQVSPHFKSWELLGDCYMRLGHPLVAFAPLATAMVLNGGARAPTLLAQIYSELGDNNRAV